MVVCMLLKWLGMVTVVIDQRRRESTACVLQFGTLWGESNFEWLVAVFFGEFESWGVHRFFVGSYILFVVLCCRLIGV